MAEVYTVTISNTTPVEITGGRVGHFVARVENYHGSLFVGGSDLSVSYSPTVVSNGLHPSPGTQAFDFYVTSPDEVFAVLVTGSTSSDTMTVFHNR